MRWLSIDPGEVHCGVAGWNGDDCRFAQEWTPEQLLERIQQWQARLEKLVVEEFRLYPNKLAVQSFSDLPTVKLIGKIELLCTVLGIELIMQPALIKKVVFAQAKARGHVWLSDGHGGHAKDAEAHGLYYVWRRQALQQEA